MYVTSVILCQLVLVEVQSERNEDITGYYVSHFGTLLNCFCTLLQVMSGDSWFSTVTRPQLMEGNAPVTIILIAYFCFTSMGILNILTGIFVEQTVEAARRDSEVVKEAIFKEQENALAKLFSTFQDADEDANQLLSCKEFELMLERADIMERFHELDIKPHDAAVLFALCDGDCDGNVSVNEFLAGCHKSIGLLRPLDYYEMAFEHTRMLRRIAHAMDGIEPLVYVQPSPRQARDLTEEDSQEDDVLI
jgi:hypothetical protein